MTSKYAVFYIDMSWEDLPQGKVKEFTSQDAMKDWIIQQNALGSFSDVELRYLLQQHEISNYHLGAVIAIYRVSDTVEDTTTDADYDALEEQFQAEVDAARVKQEFEE